MNVQYVNQKGLVESQVVSRYATTLCLERVKWCKRSLGKKERKKVEDVVSKCPDKPLIFFLPPCSSLVGMPSVLEEKGLSGAAESV